MSKIKVLTTKHVDPLTGSTFPVEISEDQALDLDLSIKQLIKVANAIEEVACNSGCGERIVQSLGYLLYKGVVRGYRYEQGDKDITFALTGYGHEVCNTLYGRGMMPPFDVNNGLNQHRH